MTAKEVYEAVLVEQNKGNAPSFTLEEFNYLLNKAILAHVNERFNFYNVNQQLSDDLRVLLRSQVFAATATGGAKAWDQGLDDTNGVKYELMIDTSDYLHILSVRNAYTGTVSGNNTDTAKLVFPAGRLTYDMWNLIQNNIYLRPRYSRPKFMVYDTPHNDKVTGSGNTAGHPNDVRVDLYVGVAEPKMKLDKITVDYLKIPDKVVLNEADVWDASSNDNSQVLEFPDYLKNQLVSKVVTYLIEISGDPRFNTYVQLNQMNQEIPKVPYELQQAAQQQRPQAQQVQQE